MCTQTPTQNVSSLGSGIMVTFLSFSCVSLLVIFLSLWSQSRKGVRPIPLKSKAFLFPLWISGLADTCDSARELVSVHGSPPEYPAKHVFWCYWHERCSAPSVSAEGMFARRVQGRFFPAGPCWEAWVPSEASWTPGPGGWSQHLWAEPEIPGSSCGKRKGRLGGDPVLGAENAAPPSSSLPLRPLGRPGDYCRRVGQDAGEWRTACRRVFPQPAPEGNTCQACSHILWLAMKNHDISDTA